jgi:UDPglucose 6-dehydrogenase
MRVSIVGSGYVGLVTGVCLAEKGHQVACIDLDPRKVESINAGIPPFHETGLEFLLRRHAGSRMRATADLEAAVLESDLTLIAVGTPFDGHAIDLTQIRAATAAIGRALKKKTGWHMVAVKSTVVPGTTDGEILPLLERESGKSAGPGFGLGMNPEFLTEGEAVEDFLRPDRLVLGALDSRSLQALEDLYEGFPGVERIRVNCRTAEMIKYAGNCLLATLISFSNEIANLASALGGVDAMDVVQGLRSSRYLNVQTDPGKSRTASIADFLVPGCGFGGSCLPKDTSALIAHGKSLHASMKVLEAVRDTNRAQPGRILRLLEKRIPVLKDVPITVLGLAFRPGTSDMRESPAIPVIRDLLARGARVSAFDPALVPAAPQAGPNAEDDEAGRAQRFFEGQVRLCRSLEEAIADARGIVLITRWPEFRRLPELLAEGGGSPVVVDGRRMLDKNLFGAYEGIGL